MNELKEVPNCGLPRDVSL